DWKYAFSGIDVAAGNKIYNGSTLLKTDDNLATVGWYTGNSESQIHSVGAKTANRLGLFDMSGNDKEWCWDWHQNNTVTSNDTAYTSEGVIVNPLGVSSGYIKVNDTYDGYFKEARGGQYTGDAYLSCISYHGGGRVQDRLDYSGFRLAQTVTE
ncbi:MAG: SUMF1/EgtB/PvdO family nonheme iron enzyme, partial [Spirochaetales bacterium]|nr:SUMF1/EgtB/PvdO family nonheme iron enzyme [Spirochaetales bacterium]